MGFRYSVAQIRKGREGRNVGNKRKWVFKNIRRLYKRNWQKWNQEKRKHNKWKFKDSLMSREDGDENGYNGSHSDHMGNLPAVLWHCKLHLPGVKMPANDPSSLLPSTIIVGCEIYWFCPLFCSLTLHQMHFAAGFVIIWATQKSKTVVQEQGWWTELWSKSKHDCSSWHAPLTETR